MRNYQTCPRPILKPKPKIQQLTILSISPQPPTVHRDPPTQPRDFLTLNNPTVRVRKSLVEAIDYTKLTPNQQAKWDAGIYGSIEQKNIKGHQYFYLRWLDPETKKYRSTYLAKEWDKAILKLQKLTGHI